MKPKAVKLSHANLFSVSNAHDNISSDVSAPTHIFSMQHIPYFYPLSHYTVGQEESNTCCRGLCQQSRVQQMEVYRMISRTLPYHTDPPSTWHIDAGLSRSGPNHTELLIHSGQSCLHSVCKFWLSVCLKSQHGRVHVIRSGCTVTAAVLLLHFLADSLNNYMLTHRLI